LANTVKTLFNVETVQPLAISITTVLSERLTDVLSIRDQQQTTLYRHRTVQLEEKSKQEQQRSNTHNQLDSKSIQSKRLSLKSLKYQNSLKSKPALHQLSKKQKQKPEIYQKPKDQSQISKLSKNRKRRSRRH
jgi:hypothetical protein